MDYGPVRAPGHQFFGDPPKLIDFNYIIGKHSNSVWLSISIYICSALLLDDSETSAQGPGAQAIIHPIEQQYSKGKNK